MDRDTPGRLARASTVSALLGKVGPRNRRRLIGGGIALGVAGAIIAAVLLAHPGNHSAVSSTPASQTSPVVSKHQLTFGMTPKQVERLTGKPAVKRRSCWFFHPSNQGMVGSISVQPSFARSLPYDPKTTGDLKLCFLGRVYSYSELHTFDKRNDKWSWEAWPLTRVPVHAPSQ